MRVLESYHLWGHDGLVIWDPSTGVVASVPVDQIHPLSDQAAPSTTELVWRAAASRVADALCRGMLLAPLEGTVIPLPHQLQALSRAVGVPRIRFLLADEVGLGKTIEAGLIIREMKLQGRLRRTLVMAPKGLVVQWVQEMRIRFNETFHLVFPSDVSTLQRTGAGGNPWSGLDQVVCPIDAFKPLDRRRGWTREQVAAYNHERSGLLLSAGWDLIVVDEAHRLGGSTEDVARHRFGEMLAASSPHLLLLSATPHQGKTDSFLRLMRLLAKGEFPDGVTHIAGRVAPYLIRTEKRRAVNAEGEPLFKPRHTRLCPVAWRSDQTNQRLLYEAVTDYVREGYNRAVRERRYALGFLMILMQRLVTSSTRAIRTAMEKRLSTLNAENVTPLFGRIEVEEATEAEMSDPEADVQDALDDLVAMAPGNHHERTEVEHLLHLARRVETEGPDAKAVTLLELIRGLRQAEDNPGLKFLVFTEFIPTQEMLRVFLAAHGFHVTCLNGAMSLDERRETQTAFAGPAQVMLSTDAGGEGLNLQFCHVIVNYDLPWNPMRIEQRIGRVDRIGQDHDVTAINLVFQDTVEHRVREVLEEKLSTILAEFGVDKTGDVLETVEAGAAFDRLYADVVVDPDQAEARIEDLVADVRARALSLRAQAQFLDGSEGRTNSLDPEPARAVLNHPLPGWVEILVLRYLEDAGGSWSVEDGVFSLRWPDGLKQRGVFDPGEAVRRGLSLLSFQDEHIRTIALSFPGWVPGQPIPVTDWPGLMASIEGTFGVYRLSVGMDARVQADPRRDFRILPLFVHADGRHLAPTARYLWDRVLSVPPPVNDCRHGEQSSVAVERIDAASREAGLELFNELMAARGSDQARIPRLDLLFALIVRKEVLS